MSAFDRRYFETSYRDYERQNPPRKLAHYRRAVERFAPGRDPRRLLDLGCAFGLFLGVLDRSFEVYGIDPSAYAIERAERDFPRATLSVASATEIPFPGPFDVITAWDALEHVEDLDAAGRAIDASLARDGVLLFAVPVYDGPLGWAVAALDRDPTHVHRESRRFWLDWAAARGSVVDWWGIFRYLVPGGPYVHGPTRALRAVAPAVLVAVRRAG